MAKVAKVFRGVRKGRIYPDTFQPGDDCPPELEAAARALGALVVEQEPAKRRGASRDRKSD